MGRNGNEVVGRTFPCCTDYFPVVPRLLQSQFELQEQKFNELTSTLLQKEEQRALESVHHEKEFNELKIRFQNELSELKNGFDRENANRRNKVNKLFYKKRLDMEGLLSELRKMKSEVGQLRSSVGGMLSNYEHTVLLRPNCKEVVSRGLDF